MNDFPVGSVITQGTGLVEQLLLVDEEGYHLRALYLSKRFATDSLRSNLTGYRLATEEDCRLAVASAERMAGMFDCERTA